MPHADDNTRKPSPLASHQYESQLRNNGAREWQLWGSATVHWLWDCCEFNDIEYSQAESLHIDGLLRKAVVLLAMSVAYKVNEHRAVRQHNALSLTSRPSFRWCLFITPNFNSPNHKSPRVRVRVRIRSRVSAIWNSANWNSAKWNSANWNHFGVHKIVTIVLCIYKSSLNACQYYITYYK